MTSRTRSPPPDSMKDSILKESTAGWSNAISPLRIAKRESVLGSNSGSDPAQGVARRSSNSYKHVWTNNLVSKSPFKSQIPTSARLTPRASPIAGTPSRTPRKVSGEKRPRPDSLVHQAEAENAQRTRELGFKRRQSKGFQGLVEKEPVTKSPFRRIATPTQQAATQPISITLPSYDDDTTSIDTDTVSSRGKDKDDMFDSPPPLPPPKPMTPLRPATPQDLGSNGSPMRNPPLPSASQVSPTRSSLVSKRLMGPRCLSNSPSDTPNMRERRKTVTFDERCDVLEFDRESHEDVTFTSDEEEDEGVYARPDENGDDDSRDSINSVVNATITFADQNAGVGEESISGLVESMLQESFVQSEEPLTPAHEATFTFGDLMKGGDEGGVPHGRTHHSDRARQANESQRGHRGEFQGQMGRDEGSDLSFSSISLSTPPQSRQPLPQHTPLPVVLPPDAERVEDGMPLVRSHRAERARQARSESLYVEDDVRMLSPSPSPGERYIGGHRTTDPIDALLPKFDIGLKNVSPRNDKDRNMTLLDDPFGMSNNSQDGFKLELDFDMSILSNTSIASFHEFTPHSADGDFDPKDELEGEEGDQVVEETPIPNASQQDESLSNFPTADPEGQQIGECPEELSPTTTADPDGIQVDDGHRAEADELCEGRKQTHSNESSVSTSASPSPTRPNPSQTNVNAHQVSTPPLSYSTLAIRKAGSTSSLRSPRISWEDIKRRALEQRGLAGCTPSPSRALPDIYEGRVIDSNISSGTLSPYDSHTSLELERVSLKLENMESPSEPITRVRPPLEERLKKALSPARPPSPLQSIPLALPQPHIPCQPVLQPSPRPGTTHISTPSRDPPSRPVLFDFGQPGVEIGDMKSALDRLVQDVNGQRQQKHSVEDCVRTPDINASGDISMDTELTEITDLSHGEVDLDVQAEAVIKEELSGKPLERANTAPMLSLPSTFDPSFNVGSRVSSNSSSIAPPVPPKPGTGNARKEREDLIKAKRREQRALEEGEFVPPRRDSAGNLSVDVSPKPVRKGLGRRSGRRSLSTGDAEDLRSPQPGSQRRVSVLKNQRGGVLGIPFEDAEDPLSDSIERELRKYEAPTDRTYHLREHEGTIYASSSDETVAHMSRVGDIDSGKAWRPVRRPSDMNEYSRQIKEFQSQEKSGKAYGRVFVKVLGVKNLTVPLPNQATAFTCTLNNGIHFVTTPESRLTRDSRIEQEFELIEHGKLEFTLTLKVRRDPHIMAQFKAMTPAPPIPSPSVPTPPSRGGMRSFFGGAAKKPKSAPHAATPPAAPVIEENLARYLKPDGTLARAFVSFKEIASRCDTRLFETGYQLIGQRLEGSGSSMAPRPVGEIVLQVFRLPPLPGIPQDQLPQSLEECHRGLRHINWHKVTYHEGTLTQLGGDCTTWRRRRLRVIGANLVAFNDITKKATAAIDLKKAISVEDDQAACVPDAQSPASARSTASRRDIDDFDAIYGVERSFKLIFPNDQEIAFFADSDEEKAKWLDVLRALVGRIPPNPLWAELIWQRQDEMARADHSRPPAALPPSKQGAAIRRQR